MCQIHFEEFKIAIDEKCIIGNYDKVNLFKLKTQIERVFKKWQF